MGGRWLRRGGATACAHQRRDGVGHREYFEAEDALGQWIEERCTPLRAPAKAYPSCSPTGASGRNEYRRVRRFGQAFRRTHGHSQIRQVPFDRRCAGAGGYQPASEALRRRLSLPRRLMRGRVTDLTGLINPLRVRVRDKEISGKPVRSVAGPRNGARDEYDDSGPRSGHRTGWALLDTNGTCEWHRAIQAAAL